jgi:hypothetical protein
MQLTKVSTALALYLLLSNAEGFGIPEVGSMASQLKEAASQSFLRTRGGQDEDPAKTVKSDKVQDMHEVEDEEENEEIEGHSSGAVTEYTGTHESTNSSDIWAYERENDDGSVLTGSNPFENRTMQSLEEDDEPNFFEQEEDEIPEEWTDPTNSTDEWAYEKAHDDGTVLYGTNPLEAAGFVWEQDDLSDDEDPQEKANSDEQQEEDATQSENQVVLHAGKDSMEQDQDEWVTGEEVDDGTVVYGTNPLENQSDDEEEEADDVEYNAEKEDAENEVAATATNSSYSTGNTTHDEEEEDYDDGTLDYGTNPMEMPDDSDDESDEEGGDVHAAGLNSTQTDNEPEEYDDGTVLYGTNPLEPSDEEESTEKEVAPSSEQKALPAPAQPAESKPSSSATPAPSQDANKTGTQMAV